MPDTSQYKVGVVLSVEDCSGSGSGKSNKTLRACQVNIGNEGGNPITVVTAATNVREGSRIAVAPVGSTFESEEGEEITVKKTVVGGVMSEGLFCDSRMLGWIGGANGVAAQMPETLDIGLSPPSTKPRPMGAPPTDVDDSAAPEPGLFEKKLSKEEKKRLAKEKREAKKAAKET